jgi:signal transduction histidine kinase
VDLPDALAIVGRTMLDVFGADGLSFCVLDANRNEIRSISNTGRVLLPLQRVYQAVPVDSVPFAAGALQGQDVMIGTPDPPACASDGQEAVPVAYLMLLPLRARGEIIGLMALVSTERDKEFSPAQVGLAETIAGSVAADIETNRLFIEEQQQRQAAESLREVVAVLSSSLDVDTVFERVFNQLHRVVTFDTAGIWLVDGDELKLADSVGLARGAPTRRILLADDVPPVRVLRQEQPILIPTVESDGRWPTLVDAARSWAGAPLTAGEQVIGVLTVAHHAPGNYHEGDLATLAVFAAQAAIAIDNATRYRRAHVEGADEERQRLARELHDSVTQALFSASLVADVLPVIWARSTAEGEETLATLRRMTRGALAEMRTLLLELRPDALAQAQLDTIIETLITATGSQQVLEIIQRLDRTPILPAEVQIALYRTVQEALNNIVKHAQAKSMRVELTVSPPVAAQDPKEWRGQLTITVTDDGRGFNQQEVSSDHLGLVIMGERMSSIGAKLAVKSAPGEGTCITVTWSNVDG